MTKSQIPTAGGIFDLGFGIWVLGFVYRPMLARWLTFNAVGMIGAFLQLACLWLLREVVQLPYQFATAAAVELTVLHNFAWHVRWTWRDRPVPASALLWRLLRFNASNGAFSIAGNVLLMAVFLRFLPGHYLLANLASIAICSMVNFVAADLWAFRQEESAKTA